MKDNNSYIAGLLGPPTPVESRHTQHRRTSVASSNKVGLKSKHFDRDAKTVHKVTKTMAKAVSKKKVSSVFHEDETRWTNDIPSRVIQLEKELGVLDLSLRLDRTTSL